MNLRLGNPKPSHERLFTLLGLILAILSSGVALFILQRTTGPAVIMTPTPSVMTTPMPTYTPHPTYTPTRVPEGPWAIIEGRASNPTGALQGIPVELIGSTFRYKCTTDALGRFEFREIPAGEYQLEFIDPISGIPTCMYTIQVQRFDVQTWGCFSYDW